MPAFILVNGGTSSTTDAGQDLFLTVGADPDNPMPGDLHVANGDVHLTTAADALRQDLQSRGRFMLGEWFLDTSEGMPYLTHVHVKNPNMVVVRNIFRQMIIDTPNVSLLRSLSLVLDHVTRSLRVDYEVVMGDGTPVSGDFTAFVIRGLSS